MSNNLNHLSPEVDPEMRLPRRNLRFSPLADAPPVRFVDEHQHEALGVLENESYSGIAAILATDRGLQNNTPVTVHYFGHPMRGMIRRLERRADGKIFIAIEWI